MQETPKPGVFQEAQIYPVPTAGKGSKRLGWFAHRARAAKLSQGYSLPRGEENYQGGKNLGGLFGWVNGDRSAGVKLEGTLNPKFSDGAHVVKYRGALRNSTLTPVGKKTP